MVKTMATGTKMTRKTGVLYETMMTVASSGHSE